MQGTLYKLSGDSQALGSFIDGYPKSLFHVPGFVLVLFCSPVGALHYTRDT